ncbi:antimicrobial peptide microplusin-like isoform X2 [Dermacentor albipictus]|uniref:antimicrobial peptide microplusin-like isoform X2 n=1 Tax=Dermacentor albipictus TaxID=60249 RepID=UPI0031FDF9F7
MKLLLACALFVCSAVFTSALQSPICFASEDQVKEQTACVRDQAGEFNDRLDLAVNNLGCTDDVCAIKKLCTFVSTDRALTALFTRPEKTFLRTLSLRCSAAAALVGTPAVGLPVQAAFPAAVLPAAAVPVAAAGPSFLAPTRAFGARAFGLGAYGAGAYGVGAYGPGAYGLGAYGPGAYGVW